MTSKVTDQIAKAREAFKETKVKSVDRTQELLEKRYRPDAVTPLQPEPIDEEYQEYLEAQRRLDELIAKRRQQPQSESAEHSSLPEYVQNFLRGIK